MEYIEEQLNLAYKQKEYFLVIIEDSVNELKPFIRELIKARWLRGESVDGGKIINQSTGLGYSLSYKALKLSMGRDGDVDLTLTGALGDSIQIVVTNGNHEIISTDSKYFAIGTKYGFKEFGLNNQEYIVVMDKLGLIISEKITNLKF